MHYGQVSGITKPISRLVQGTAAIDPDNRDATFQLLDLALEQGYNTFDTAENYGPAKEKIFGSWVRERGVRDQVAIIAKGAHHYNGRNRVTPEDIQTDMQGSFENMGLDYFDLYVLHRDDPAYPVGPIVETLTEHVRAGRIGAFGGSNWKYERIRAANEYAAAHGLIPFAVSSPNYSLAEQIKEPWENCVTVSGPQGEEARAWYAQEQIALFTWSSLAGGFFSDRFHRDNLDTFAKDDYWAQICLNSYISEPNFQRLDRARELAQAKGVSVPQIALAFVVNQPLNIFGLVFCANKTQFEQNAAALDLALTPEELASLDLKS